MAIETTSAGTTITGEHIDLYRFLMIMRGMAMDVRGLKPTRGFSTLKLAAEYGVKAKTKKQALAGMVELMKQADPKWEPTGTIAKALGL